jgi:membrane protein implicated in regulation of membrane protease activity
MLGGSALIAIYGMACLIACAVIAISGAVPAWLAALIVGAALLAAAAVAALLGKRRLQQAVPPVPEQAAEGVKTDIEQVKESARR